MDLTYRTAVAILFGTLCLNAEGQDVHLLVNAETGDIESGIEPPLTESYSFEPSSTVVDGQGNNYVASEWHAITAEPADWARDGSHVLKFFADGSGQISGEPASRRAELDHSPQVWSFEDGEEWFYSLSFWPPPGVWDEPTLYSTVISQWKQYGGGNPNMEIRLSNEGDYLITTRSVHHWDSDDDEGDVIGVAQPDAWNDLKVHVRNASGSDGFYKIWLNGALVFEHLGPTMYLSDVNGYMKFGLYTEIYDARTLYFDAVEIADHLDIPFEEWVSNQANLPSVTLTSPAEGDNPSLGETITLTAAAVDPGGAQLGSPGSIVGVAFFAGDSLLGTAMEAPYSWSWTGAAQGFHTLRCVATDEDGNVAESTPVTIHMGGFLPEATWLSPAPFSNTPLGTPATLAVNATDADGTVDAVEFFVDGVLVGEADAGALEFDWMPTQAGIREVMAVVVDNDGNETTAGPVAITVGATEVEVNLEAIHDASLRQGSPDSPANWSKVEVYSNPNNPIVGVFQFDLDSIDASYVVRSAQFRAYSEETEGMPVSLSLHEATHSDWVESEVTWNNGPSRGEGITSAVIESNLVYTDFEMTEWFREAVSASPDAMSFWLEEPTGEYLQTKFSSHVRPNPPFLTLALSHFPGTTGCLADVDADGICDEVDDCVGYVDECGQCNGPGAVLECGCEEIPAGACDCEGNLVDALGVCEGSCQSDTNLNGICDDEDVLGCTYQDALNYDPMATMDSGACMFAPCDGNPGCSGDLNGDGSVGVSDLLNFLGQFGSVC